MAGNKGRFCYQDKLQILFHCRESEHSHSFLTHCFRRAQAGDKLFSQFA
jgi:hypothetical protein